MKGETSNTYTLWQIYNDKNKTKTRKIATATKQPTNNIIHIFQSISKDETGDKVNEEPNSYRYFEAD